MAMFASTTLVFWGGAETPLGIQYKPAVFFFSMSDDARASEMSHAFVLFPSSRQ